MAKIHFNPNMMPILVALMMFTFKIVQTAPHVKPTEYICGSKPGDVMFILDTSRSIWKPDFSRQQDFVKDVIDIFPISEDEMRVGAVTYSEHARLYFYLNRYYDKEDIKAAVDNIRQDAGILTYTDRAIRFIREIAFTADHGSRKNVTKVAIVITDGRSHDVNETALQAKKARDEGIHIFAIGVGNKTLYAELEAIASSPASQYVFTVQNYSGLSYIKDVLAIQTCTVTDPPTTIPPSTTTTIGLKTVKFLTPPERLDPEGEGKHDGNLPFGENHVLEEGKGEGNGKGGHGEDGEDGDGGDGYHEVGGRMPGKERVFYGPNGLPLLPGDDGYPPGGHSNIPFGVLSPYGFICDLTSEPTNMVFVLDSNDKGTKGREEMWNAARDIIKGLNVAGIDDNVWIEFVQNCMEVPGFHLNKFTNKTTLLSEFDRLTQRPSKPHHMIRQMKNKLNQHGSDRRKIGIYMTDGPSGDLRRTLHEAQMAKMEEDIEIFGIGFGDNIDETELRAIVSCAVDDHLVTIPEKAKAHMPQLVQTLLPQICAGLDENTIHH